MKTLTVNLLETLDTDRPFGRMTWPRNECPGKWADGIALFVENARLGGKVVGFGRLADEGEWDYIIVDWDIVPKGVEKPPENMHIERV